MFSTALQRHSAGLAGTGSACSAIKAAMVAGRIAVLTFAGATVGVPDVSCASAARGTLATRIVVIAFSTAEFDAVGVAAYVVDNKIATVRVCIAEFPIAVIAV